MTRTTFNSLFNEAKNYLIPETNPSVAKKEREQFINYLEKNGLVEQIFTKINKDSNWEKLAQTKGIFYLIDVNRQKSIFDDDINPKIYLIILDNKPIIKLVCITNYYNY